MSPPLPLVRANPSSASWGLTCDVMAEGEPVISRPRSDANGWGFGASGLRGFGASGLRGSLDLCRRTVGIRLLWGSVLGFVVVICLFILDVEINVFNRVCVCL